MELERGLLALERDKVALARERIAFERERLAWEMRRADGPLRKTIKLESPWIEIVDSPRIEADAELEVDRPAAPTASVVAPQERVAELVADQPAAPTLPDVLKEHAAFVARAERLAEFDRVKGFVKAKRLNQAFAASVRPPPAPAPQFLPIERVVREEGEIPDLPTDLVRALDEGPHPILWTRAAHDVIASLPKY